mmetsp:Transcript_13121/g.43016  ORF Transcript_13121/g.43016 Transcript_13121/m.43016 type:complete len:252 (-) Transcript_13121:423-1178(-)
MRWIGTQPRKKLGAFLLGAGLKLQLCLLDAPHALHGLCNVLLLRLLALTPQLAQSIAECHHPLLPLPLPLPLGLSSSSAMALPIFLSRCALFSCISSWSCCSSRSRRSSRSASCLCRSSARRAATASTCRRLAAALVSRSLCRAASSHCFACRSRARCASISASRTLSSSFCLMTALVVLTSFSTAWSVRKVRLASDSWRFSASLRLRAIQPPPLRAAPAVTEVLDEPASEAMIDSRATRTACSFLTHRRS